MANILNMFFEKFSDELHPFPTELSDMFERALKIRIKRLIGF